MKTKSFKKFRSKSREKGNKLSTLVETCDEFKEDNGGSYEHLAMKSKSKSENKALDQLKSNNIDDYGFLSWPTSKPREPRVTVCPHSPRSEVDYFDDSLFDIGYIDKPPSGSIPVTLGSINSTSNSLRGSICNDMPQHPMVAQNLVYENSYMNISCPTKENSDIYHERSEGHYARLSDLKAEISARENSRKSGNLNFYEIKAAEQRVRSRSRNPDDRRPRSRSGRSCSRSGRSCSRSEQQRSRSRGCSASRDIMALYTNNPIASVKMRRDSISPDRSTQHSRNSSQFEENLTSKTYKQINQKVTRPTSLGINQSNKTDRKNKENVKYRSRNQNLRASVTSRHDDDSEDSTCSMTILEMDVERNYKIEKELLAANSYKPANIRMMMVAPHAPENNWASKDEVTVRAGEIVTAIYKQNEWLYILKENGAKGFVPYAYTKAIKMSSLAGHAKSTTKNTEHRKSPLPCSAKPVAGILKTSNQSKQKSKLSLPKYSVKVRTAADNDSLSSECSSAFTDDFVYTRMKSPKSETHADCIVIDTDDISPKLEALNHSEETGTYCSDSGISDPNSNHSEDLDLLHSPLSISGDTNDSGIQIPLSTPRLPKERIVSVTTQFLESATSPYSSVSSPVSNKTSKELHSQGRHRLSATISDMPLGPLGARLAKLDLEKKSSNVESPSRSKAIGGDMRDRAKSNNIPSALRPEIPKDYNGPRVTVVFDYSAENEDDLEVKASDIVTVLNGEDIEWIWVQRRDGKEGFIPRQYVIPLEISLQNNRRRIGVAVL